MIEVTVWKCLNSKGIFEHNHIDIGHTLSDSPKPMNEYQKNAWKNKTWNKIHTFGSLEKPMVVS